MNKRAREGKRGGGDRKKRVSVDVGERLTGTEGERGGMRLGESEGKGEGHVPAPGVYAHAWGAHTVHCRFLCRGR